MTRKEELLELLKQYADANFEGPRSSEEIDELRQLFRLPLPTDYLDFLAILGSGEVGSEEFIGLSALPHRHAPHVVRDLRRPTRLAPFPEHIIPLSADGGGDYECLDLARSNPDSSVIVNWSHATGVQPDVIAVGFWEWMRGLLDAEA